MYVLASLAHFFKICVLYIFHNKELDLRCIIKVTFNFQKYWILYFFVSPERDYVITDSVRSM